MVAGRGFHRHARASVPKHVNVSGAMKSCSGMRDRLMDLIEGELTADEHRRIEAHVSQCSECSREVRALRETLEQLRSLPEPTVPAGRLDGFSAAVLRRISDETPPRIVPWHRVAAWLSGRPSLRPVPALSAAVVLGCLLAIGLVRTSHVPQPSPVPEVVVVGGETLSIAQNLDVLEQFDLLEDLDLLEQLPLIQAPENGRPLKLS